MEVLIEHAPSRARTVPMTHQQRFLFEARKKNNTLRRLDTMTLRLSGKVRPELLLNSFEQVILRHDALRTRLVEVNGAWTQEIRDIQECQIRFRDISNHPSHENEESVLPRLDELIGKCWILDDAPLYYVDLLKVSESRFFLSHTLHHLIYDGYSINLIFRDIWSLYPALLRGQHPVLAEVPLQYSDYAIRQQREEAAWRDNHDAYWRARLDGASCARWPDDGGTAGVKTCATARARVPMDATLFSRLRQFARRERTLPSIVTLAAYVAVVSQQCEVRDFVLPMNVAGRCRADESALVGYLGHFLYLRMQLTENERFTGLLDKVRRELSQAMVHQDFGKVSGDIPELVGGVSFNWIKGQWEEMFGVPTQPEQAKLDIQVEAHPAAPFGQIVNFEPTETEGPAALLSELGFLFLENRDGITIVLSYRADLYSATAAGAALTSMSTALAKFLGDPYTRISTIEPAAPNSDFSNRPAALL